jgi:hypothetical protein
MKTVGNIISALFDEQFLNKAQGFSKLFDSWADITEKNGITAAADHSRIKELDKGILLIETDHPGWKQIIQTKQSKLLNDFRYRFPGLDISAISLMLGRSEAQKAPLAGETVASVTPVYGNEETSKPALDAIKDEDFKDKLRRLEQTIVDREKA